MNARRFALLSLAPVFFLTSSVYAGGISSRDAAAQAEEGALDALSRLVEDQGDEAEAAHRFQKQYAAIQRSVADNDTLNSRGGLVDAIQSLVLDRFLPEKRVALGRQLVALTQTESIETDPFFELITLGAYFVITEGQAQDVAETARRIANQASNSDYDPEPLLQDLVMSIAMVDPEGMGSSPTAKRIYSFFFCLLDCLGPLSEREGAVVTWLENNVLAYLCQIRGEGDDCSEKKDQLKKWAGEAEFPSCPTSIK